MSQARVIVATPYEKDLLRCQEIIDGFGGLKLVAHAPGLMELFNKVESDPPNLVLLSADLCQKPDFELMVTLFKALDVRWSMFESAADEGESPRVVEEKLLSFLAPKSRLAATAKAA